MHWALYFDREAVEAMYTIPVEIGRRIKPIIWALPDDPTPANMQADEDNPSWYWLALPGDYLVTYETVDEAHLIRMVDIE